MIYRRESMSSSKKKMSRKELSVKKNYEKRKAMILENKKIYKDE